MVSTYDRRKEDMHALNEVRRASARRWPLTRCNGKRPVDHEWQKCPNKHPFRPEDIEQWVLKGNNVALVTGPASGVAVLDFDVEKDHEGNPVETMHSVLERVDQMGLPQTPMVETGGGGLHLYFAIPDGVHIPNSTGKVADRVDVRGEGGCVVFPGSRHPKTGKFYRWRAGYSPDECDLAPFPPHLLQQKQMEIAPKGKGTDWPPCTTFDWDSILSDSDMPDNEAAQLCWAYVQKCPDAISGNGGHDATFRAACECFRFGLTESQARWVMDKFNTEKTGDKPWTDSELDHKIQDAWKLVQLNGEFGMRLNGADQRNQISGEEDTSEAPDKDSLSPVNMTGWYDETPPELDFIFNGLVPRGTLTGLVAQGGMGKGWLTQQLIVSAAIGRKLVGEFIPAGAMRVLWIESEDPAEEIHRRYAKIVSAFTITKEEHERIAENVRLYAGKAFPLVEVDRKTRNVSPTARYNEIRGIVREWKPDLIVIDPLSHFYGGDENDNVVMATFVNHLKALVDDIRTTIWVNHHVAKSREEERTSGAGRGASSLRDTLRSMFSLAPLTEAEVKEFGITDQSLYVSLCHTKTNWTRRTGHAIYLKRDVSGADVSGVLRVVDLESDRKVDAEEMLNGAAGKLADIIGENPNNLTENDISNTQKGNDICTKLKKEYRNHGTKRAIREVMNRAKELGLLIIEKKGSSRIPRKNDMLKAGFWDESGQNDEPGKKPCQNSQPFLNHELTKDGQSDTGNALSHLQKTLTFNDLQKSDKLTPKGGAGAVRFRADAPPNVPFSDTGDTPCQN